MKKFVFIVSAVVAICFYTNSGVEASTVKSKASISFYEDDAGEASVGDESENINNIEDEKTTIDEVEEGRNQGIAPKTGDISSMKYILLGCFSLCFLILLIARQKRKSNQC